MALAIDLVEALVGLRERPLAPGIFFFSGRYPDYHQPSDTDRIRYVEPAKIVDLAAAVVRPYQEAAPGRAS